MDTVQVRVEVTPWRFESSHPHWAKALLSSASRASTPGAPPPTRHVGPGAALSFSRFGLFTARREPSPRAQLLAALQRPWLQILLVGTLLFVVLTRVTIDTQNINLVPSVIVLGSFLVPLAFVMYVYERATEVPLTVVLGCFVTGGILGVTAASVLEYRTVLEVGALPTIAIGLSE